MSKELETRRRNTNILLGITGVLGALGVLSFTYLVGAADVITDGKLDLHFGSK